MGKRVPRRRPDPGDADMLTEGNDHLGRSLHGFTLPAITTCPGLTGPCKKICYALKFLFRINGLRYERQFRRAQRAPVRFAADITLEIRFKRVKVLRIHVGGDFFNAAYVRAWTRIARSCRGTKFLFYTRSWRVPELVPALLELAAEKNVYAWWSEDRESGVCTLPHGRRCYLCVDEADLATVPPDVELVFREDTRTPLKWVGSAWICAKEQGVPHGLTCESCKRCFVPGPMPRRRA